MPLGIGETWLPDPRLDGHTCLFGGLASFGDCPLDPPAIPAWDNVAGMCVSCNKQNEPLP